MTKRLNGNQVICGDSAQILKSIPDEYIDLTVTSPPYDDLRNYNGYSFDFETIAKELFRVTKNGGVVVWVINDQTKKGNESGTSFKHALYFKQIGFNLFDTMIYLKPPRGASGNNKTYWQTFEYMFIFSKGKPNTINLLLDRENKEARNGDNGTKRLYDGSLKKLNRGGYSKTGRRTNVWHYNIGNGHSATDNIAHQHPAIFPEKLAEDHILSWSNKNDLVLDPLCGSGTTLKMAKSLNRNYIGIDISQEYVDLTNKRLEKTQMEITQ